MPALQKAGVTLVAEGVDQFVINLNKANESLERFSQNVDAMSAVQSSMAATGNAVTNLGNSVSKGMATATESLSTGAQGLMAIMQTMQIPAPDLDAAGWNMLADKIAEPFITGQQSTDEFKAALNKALPEVQAQMKRTADEADNLNAKEELLSGTTLAVAASMSALGIAGLKTAATIGLTASRIEELEIILEVTRQNAIRLAEADGDMAKASTMTAGAVQGQVQAIRDLHINGIVANQTVAELIRYGLDWTRASELARLAQDSATYAMQDSSQAIQGLVHGIVTLQTRTLRNYGVMINLNAAYADYAKANNLVTTELTEAQKQQAAYNAVLAQAPNIQGAYSAAMQTSSKMTRSLRTDLINLSEAFGQYYTPALDAGVGATRGIINGLINLPSPIQAAISGFGATGSAVLGLAGASLILIPRLDKISAAMQAVTTFTGLSRGALLGLGAVIPVVVGVTAALVEQEKVRQREATAIATTADTYPEYIRSLEIAERTSYALTEQLWKQVKAQDAANQGAYTQRLYEAQQAIQGTLKMYTAQLGSLDQMVDALKRVVGGMDEYHLAVLADEEATYNMAIQMGLAEPIARALADAYAEVAQAEIDAKKAAKELADEVAASNPEQEDFYQRHRTIIPYINDEANAMTRLAVGVYAYSDAVRAAIQNDSVWYSAAASAGYEDRLKYEEKLTQIFEDSVWERLQAYHQYEQDLIQLDRDRATKSRDLWRDYVKAVNDADADIVAFHAGTLDELVKLDEKAAKERAKLWEDYQDDLRKAEEKFRQDMADLDAKRTQDIADSNREYAQKQKDALSDLNRDLEDIKQKHLDKMGELEADYYAGLADLAKEYGEKVKAVTEDYAKQRQDILDKYNTAPEGPTLDQQRESLIDQIRALEQQLNYPTRGISPYKKGAMQMDLAELKKQLEALKQQELDALEERKQDELDELKKWLADEEAAKEQAWKDAQDKEVARYEKEKTDRQQKYQDQLDDLKLAHDRELEEIQRNFERRQKELADALEREKQQALDNYNDRIQDAKDKLDEQKAAILEKLQEQLDAAKEKYAEGLSDLGVWYDDQKELIKQKYDDQNAEIEYQVGQGVLKAQQEFDKLPAAFQPTWNTLLTQAQTQAAGFVDAIIAEFQRLFDFFQIGSPSKLMEDFAKNINAGMSDVWNKQSGADLFADSFDTDAMQANINAALGGVNLSQVMPPQQAIVPSMGSTNTTTSNITNLTMTAQYKNPQRETTLRNDVQALLMGMNAIPPRNRR